MSGDISSIADLLQQLREKELAALDQYREIPHAPIIGDMFEGLTRDLVERSIFEEIPLRVVTGMIKGSGEGEYSRQLDCMVVVGEGESVPFTEHQLYPGDQVIAVIEVKTNLYKSELIDSFANLRSVIPLAKRDVYKRVVERNFRSIAREEIPTDKSVLPLERQMLLDALTVEATQPAKIVLGHFGYASEHSLRSGLLKLLDDNVSADPETSIPGFGPTSLPDLVLCRNSGLVKINGLPYSYPLDDEDFWPLLFSFEGRPFHFFLEILWTRINLTFPLPANAFGEDLERDAGSPLLFAKAARREERTGWIYKSLDLHPDELSNPDILPDWEPVEITLTQGVALQIIGLKDSLDPTDEDFLEFLDSQGEDAEAFIEDLIATNLVYRNRDGLIRYLTEQCMIANLPDGRSVAGDNAAGRLTSWIDRQIEIPRDQHHGRASDS